MKSLKLIRGLLTASVLIPVAVTEARQATGSLAGCVTDTMGVPAAGVRVIVEDGLTSRQAITDAAGCYDLDALEAGSYIVLACLPGFATVGCNLTLAQGVKTQDFQIKPAPICECITYPALGALWRVADAVVRVRVGGRRLGPNLSDGASLIHAATVMTVWKSHPKIGATTSELLQELGSQCQPYEVGRELVVFLRWKAEHDAFVLVNGVNGAFTLDAGRVTWAGVNGYSGKKVGDFLAELDTLASK